MPSPRRKRFWRACRHRLCAGLTLLAYLLTALGIPLPAGAQGGDHPCQGHSCGCSVSAQVSQTCCCVVAQKPVQPTAPSTCSHCPNPSADPPQGRCGGGQPECGEATTTCCAGKARSSCCEHKPATVPGTEPSAQTKQADGPPSPGGVHWVLGLSALKCQGLSTLWATSGAVLPPAPPLTWGPFFRPIGWLRTLDLVPLALATPPLTPPPRLLAL
jgi:hypothetical protein